MHVEGVPPRRAIGPTGASETIAVDDRTEALEQCPSQASLDWWQRDPRIVMAEHAVVVEIGRWRLAAAVAASQRLQPSPYVGVGSGQADPILERVLDAGRSCVTGDEQQPRPPGERQLGARRLLLGPANEGDVGVHRSEGREGRFPSCFRQMKVSRNRCQGST